MMPNNSRLLNGTVAIACLLTLSMYVLKSQQLYQSEQNIPADKIKEETVIVSWNTLLKNNASSKKESKTTPTQQLESNSQFLLVGTISPLNEKEGVALIKLSSGKVKTISVGQHITDGWMLKTVQRNQVLVTHKIHGQQWIKRAPVL